MVPARRLQKSNISAIVPWREAGSEGRAGVGSNAQHFFNRLPLFVEKVSTNTFSRLSVKFQHALAVCVCTCVFGCHWPIVTRWDSLRLCVRLSFFELPSLFNSSHCGRVGEKWEIDWGCARAVKVRPGFSCCRGDHKVLPHKIENRAVPTESDPC